MSLLDEIKVGDTTTDGTVETRAIGRIDQIPTLIDDATEIGELEGGVCVCV